MTAAGAPPAPARRRRVGLACDADVRRRYVDGADLVRLQAAADVTFGEFAVPTAPDGRPAGDPAAESALAGFVRDLDVLIVCHGSPLVSAAVLDAAPSLRMVGDLEGDRFGHRVDVAAAQRRGVRVVDTSHGSSYPTAEWALGLALVGLRNAGASFRRAIAHQPFFTAWEQRSGPGYDGAELAGKPVGMIGFGHLARHLTTLLAPFGVDVRVFDPFARRELAEPYRVRFGPLRTVMEAAVVFVLVPHTPATEGMLGATELGWLRPGAVLVNVSRGKVITSAALLDRLRAGDVIACLDVYDPEPLPLDSPLLDLDNVFLTPHIAGVTAESRRRFFSLMVDECLRHFGGYDPWSELTADTVRVPR
ncbi:MAG: NAD(P)-dependent oxidoreductase [Solirubrobacteraceae bacterium]|jgi:phosphoglycerate dehydrogenase-like enzyme